jgi:hypothetical protein
MSLKGLTARREQAAAAVAGQINQASGGEALAALRRRLAAEIAKVEEERATEEAGLRDLEDLAAEERQAYRAGDRAAVEALKERKEDARFRASSGREIRQHHELIVEEIRGELAACAEMERVKAGLRSLDDGLNSLGDKVTAIERKAEELKALTKDAVTLGQAIPKLAEFGPTQESTTLLHRVRVALAKVQL